MRIIHFHEKSSPSHALTRLRNRSEVLSFQGHSSPPISLQNAKFKAQNTRALSFSSLTLGLGENRTLCLVRFLFWRLLLHRKSLANSRTLVSVIRNVLFAIQSDKCSLERISSLWNFSSRLAKMNSTVFWLSSLEVHGTDEGSLKMIFMTSKTNARGMKRERERVRKFCLFAFDYRATQWEGNSLCSARIKFNSSHCL